MEEKISAKGDEFVRATQGAQHNHITPTFFHAEDRTQLSKGWPRFPAPPAGSGWASESGGRRVRWNVCTQCHMTRRSMLVEMAIVVDGAVILIVHTYTW